jgi:serine/threonine-protein kinase
MVTNDSGLSPSVEPLEAGSLLADRYLVEFVLGRGGMGAVYFARDQANDNLPVALKEMRVQVVDPKAQRQAIEQFRQEAHFLAHLDHPNLVKVSDFFVEQGRYYLVMAYIKGKTLGEMLKARSEPFPVHHVLEWAVQLVDVLAYLHSQDPPILFRDVKPQNIMLDSTGALHLIDFGIARNLTPDSVTATFLQGIGSADYCPLEQYQGAGGTDQRSDIYSLGATLFHLLTLQVPPRAAELVTENKPVPSPRRYNPHIPPSLEDLIVHMMALRKDDRYRSMEHVRSSLFKVIAVVERGDPAPPVGETRPKRKRDRPATGQIPSGIKSPWLAVGSLTLVVLGLLIWLAIQMTEAPARPTPTPGSGVRAVR